MATSQDNKPFQEEEIRAVVDAQRRFFRTGTTLPVKWRKAQLRKLKAAVMAHENDFVEALAEDLGRSSVEAFLCDIGPVITEINEMLAGLRRWARPERHFSGLLCFPSTCTKVYKMPYGVSLVISPFNFPVLLTLGVVAVAMAGGNTVVIKASSKSRQARRCSNVSSPRCFRLNMSHSLTADTMSRICALHSVSTKSSIRVRLRSENMCLPRRQRTLRLWRLN